MDEKMELSSDFDPRNLSAEAVDGDIDYMRDASQEPDRDLMVDNDTILDPATTDLIDDDLIQDDDMLDDELIDEPHGTNQEAFYQNHEQFHDVNEDRGFHFEDVLDATIHTEIPEINLPDDIDDLQDINEAESNPASTAIEIPHAEETTVPDDREGAQGMQGVDQADQLGLPLGAYVQNHAYDSQQVEAILHKIATEKVDTVTEVPSTVQGQSEPEAEQASSSVDNQKQQSGLDVGIGNLANLHPVKVIYDNSELCLFPPSSDDDSDTFLLQDESLAFETVNKLLTACRGILAGDVDENDELILDVDVLDLHYSEYSSHSTQVTFAQLVDVYLALTHNDGQEPAEPFYVTLRTVPHVTSRYGYLVNIAAEGKGLSHLSTEQFEYMPVNAIAGQESRLPDDPHDVSSEETTIHAPEESCYVSDEQAKVEPGHGQGYPGELNAAKPAEILETRPTANADHEEGSTISLVPQAPPQSLVNEDDLFDLDADPYDIGQNPFHRADASSTVLKPSATSAVEGNILELPNDQPQATEPAQEPLSIEHKAVPEADDRRRSDQLDHEETKVIAEASEARSPEPEPGQYHESSDHSLDVQEAHADVGPWRNEAEQVEDVSQAPLDFENSEDVVSHDEGEILEDDYGEIVEDDYDLVDEHHEGDAFDVGEIESGEEADGSYHEHPATFTEAQALTADGSVDTQDDSDFIALQNVKTNRDKPVDDLFDHRSTAPSSASLGPAPDDGIDYSEDEGLLDGREVSKTVNGPPPSTPVKNGTTQKRHRAENEDYNAMGIETPPNKRRSTEKLQPPPLAIDDEEDLDISGTFIAGAKQTSSGEVHPDMASYEYEDELDLFTPESKARPAEQPQSSKRSRNHIEEFEIADPGTPGPKRTRS